MVELQESSNLTVSHIFKTIRSTERNTYMHTLPTRRTYGMQVCPVCMFDMYMRKYWLLLIALVSIYVGLIASISTSTKVD